MKSERIDSIDIFRGIGIIIMVMGHIYFGYAFDFIIHAFHMPMFYFISGLFFKTELVNETRTIDYVKRKARSLLVPYCFFGIIHYLIWIIPNIGNDKVDLYEPLVHLVFINTQGIPIAGALWFLTSLFFAEIIYFILNKFINNKLIFHVLIVILALAGNLETSILPFQLPWAIGSSLVGVGLFDIGHMIGVKKESSYVRWGVNMSIRMMIVIGIITIALMFWGGYVNMRMSTYPNVPLFWVCAISAIIIGINISRCMDRKLPPCVKDIFTYIGQNSIVYVCLNQLVMMIIYVYLPDTVPNRLIGLVFTLFILRVCSEIINKTFLRRIIGR